MFSDYIYLPKHRQNLCLQTFLLFLLAFPPALISLTSLYAFSLINYVAVWQQLSSNTFLSQCFPRGCSLGVVMSPTAHFWREAACSEKWIRNTEVGTPAEEFLLRVLCKALCIPCSGKIGEGWILLSNGFKSHFLPWPWIELCADQTLCR